MSAPVVPWAQSRDERRMRRALRDLTPEDRAICEAVANGAYVRRETGYAPAAVTRALTNLRTAYLRED